MADITTLNGNLLLKTDPTNSNSKLSVSRTDAGATTPLAQIKMFGEGTNNFQGVMAFETMNSGSPNGPLEERMRVHTNGNVGIGTIPGDKLDINGDIRIRGANIKDAGGTARITLTDNGRLDLKEDGGNTVLSIDTAGKVGIGTSAPGAKLSINGGLHVGGDSDPGNDNLLVDGDIAISGKHAFRGSDSWLRLNQDKAFTSGVHTPGVFAPMSLNVGGAGSWGDPGRGNVWITGNVGIATDDPKAKLHVEGTNDASLTGDGLLILGTKAGNNLVMDNNEIMARNAGNIASLHFQADGGDLVVHNLQDNKQKFVVKHDGKVGIGTVNPKIHLAIGDSDTGLKQQGDGELAIYTNNQERVRIDKSGYVGIGTIDPKEKLELNGSIRGNQSGALRISTGYGYVDVGPKNSGWSHFVTDRSKYYFNKEIRVTSGMIGSYAEDLSLCTSGTERIRVKRSNGNVGIGTNNPRAKLHVNGKLHLDDDITLSPSYYSVDPYGEIREATSWIYVHGIKAIGFRLNTFHGKISAKRILICKGWTLVENFNC